MCIFIFVVAVMSSESAMKSHSVHEEASRPSSIPELKSATHVETKLNPDSEPDVVLISDDKNVKDDKSRSGIWKHFDRKLIDGLMKAICKYCNVKLRGDSGCGT